jgi:hypothetical protein
MAKNNQNNKEEKNKVDKKVLFTRVLCFVLAGLMLASSIFMILEFLL